MISLISSLSLKLYLNLLVYHGKSSGFSRNYSAIQNVREHSSGLRNNFGKFSEIFGNGQKSLENHQKRSHQYINIIKEHYTLA